MYVDGHLKAGVLDFNELVCVVCWFAFLYVHNLVEKATVLLCSLASCCFLSCACFLSVFSVLRHATILIWIANQLVHANRPNSIDDAL